MPDDQQRVEYERHESAELAKGLCPASGLLLMRAEFVFGTVLACGMCDCFGYDVADERIGVPHA